MAKSTLDSIACWIQAYVPKTSTAPTLVEVEGEVVGRAPADPSCGKAVRMPSEYHDPRFVVPSAARGIYGDSAAGGLLRLSLGEE